MGNRCKGCKESCCGSPNALSDICDECQSDPNTGWGGSTDHSKDGTEEEEDD